MASNRSIRRQIKKKQQEIRQCQLVLTKIHRENGNLERQHEQWYTQARHASQEEMTAQLVVPQRFEGKTAQQLHMVFFDTWEHKEQIGRSAEEVKAASSRAIRIIEDHIDQLEWDIQRLYDELDDDDD